MNVSYKHQKRERGLSGIGVALALAIVAALTLSAITLPLSGRGAPSTAQADGGDFSLDFAASAPFTYDHTVGGGAFDDGTIGKDKDVVESLEAGNFQCGQVVSYLMQIVVDDGATGTQGIRLTNTFTANTTGQPGAGHSQILGVYINDPASVTGGVDGPQSADSGFSGPIDSTIANTTTFVTPVLVTANG